MTLQWRIKVRNPQMLSRVKRLSIKAGWPDKCLMANVCQLHVPDNTPQVIRVCDLVLVLTIFQTELTIF